MVRFMVLHSVLQRTNIYKHEALLLAAFSLSIFFLHSKESEILELSTGMCYTACWYSPSWSSSIVEPT
jgi:uncharacterized membrane protein YozB (DUF420 family)